MGHSDMAKVIKENFATVGIDDGRTGFHIA
jgi:hypothetical protein